jgi:hypothetical protein
MLRYVKIKHGVISARCGKKYLTDKTAVYQTTMWPGEDALDLIKRGFLIEVDKDGNDLNAVPVASEIEDMSGTTEVPNSGKSENNNDKPDSESNPLDNFLNQGGGKRKK